MGGRERGECRRDKEGGSVCESVEEGRVGGSV